MILSDFIWFNSNIKADSKPVRFPSCSDKDLDFIGQLFSDNGNIKLWEDIKIKLHLKDTHKMYQLQIIDALPKTGEGIILKGKGNAKEIVIFYHHIVRKSQICSLYGKTNLKDIINPITTVC